MTFDIAEDDPYTASTGLLEMMFHVYGDPDRGSGIYVLVARSINLLGERLPQALAHNAIGKQINILGKYPVHSDIFPLILFASIFGVFTLLHLVIFIINWRRGHYFIMNALWSFNALVRMVSFILRASWAYDLACAKEGIANGVIFVLPSIMLVSTNLILAQRLFTWRHPVGGSKKSFWVVMIVQYILVVIFTIIGIVASAIPYLYFLSEKDFMIYVNLNRWLAAMQISYALSAASLIGLSFWLPTENDEKLYTYQPWWIESFAPFYFVEKNAAQKAEASFMKRNSNHRHATRVIASTHHYYKMVKGLSNERGDLTHNVSLMIVMVSTLCLFITSVVRFIVVLEAKTNGAIDPTSVPIAMYFCWGVFEVIINGLLIVGRADLRFYRPDILPEAVRAIITSEQTNVLPSTNVSEDEGESDDVKKEEDIAENTNHGYYLDISDSDDLYFSNQPTSSDGDSGKLPEKQDWKSENSFETHSHEYKHKSTLIHNLSKENEKWFILDDEFKF